MGDRDGLVVSLIIPYLRPFLIIAFLWRLPVFTKSENTLRARYVASVAIFALLFVYTASTAVWVVERKAPNATIVDLGDAIWWGFTTITTVGYGDFVPITPLGRFFAVLLMVRGIFVIGVVSATILSLLTEQLHRAAGRANARHLSAHHAHAGAADAGQAADARGAAGARTAAAPVPSPTTPASPASPASPPPPHAEG